MAVPVGSETESERPRFRGDIQGLRAIAVAAILLNHAGMPRIPGGYVGVDVFFVVSGFLITGHLAEELSATGRISLADFYTRRARRILPAAFAVIVLTVVAAIVLQPPLLLPNTLRDAAAAAVYLPNLRFAAEHTDYFKTKDDPSAFQHYWSLGLEEQFYLVWPLLILLAFVLLGRSRRGVVVMLTAVSIASFLLSVYLTHRTPLWAFFLLHTRAWEFAIGGLLAIATTARRWPDVRTIGLLGWIGLALIAYAVLRFGPRTRFPGGVPPSPSSALHW